MKNKKIDRVLLTGATGYLGAHILDELVKDKNIKIYCLVRGKSYAEAEKHLVETLKFYFGDRYDKLLNNRVFTVAGDIGCSKLGLSEENYKELGNTVDTVIHTAAIVKHYGDYSIFDKINVQGTKEVLAFCQGFDVRLAHISTISVSGNSNGGSLAKQEFSENDLFIGQDYMSSVYVRSKFEAEMLVRDAQEAGFDAMVFRVGNLTSRYSDGHFQKNANENNYYNILKSVINLKVISEDHLKLAIEFTPVDLCSKAIVGLLRQANINQKVFHIFNHKMLTLEEFVDKLEQVGINIDIVDSESYKEFITRMSEKGDDRELIAGIINNLIYADGSHRGAGIEINSEMSVEYLKNAGFEWADIDMCYIEKLLCYFEKIGFFKDKLKNYQEISKN